MQLGPLLHELGAPVQNLHASNGLKDDRELLVATFLCLAAGLVASMLCKPFKKSRCSVLWVSRSLSCLLSF